MARTTLQGDALLAEALRFISSISSGHSEVSVQATAFLTDHDEAIQDTLQRPEGTPCTSFSLIKQNNELTARNQIRTLQIEMLRNLVAQKADHETLQNALDGYPSVHHKELAQLSAMGISDLAISTLCSELEYQVKKFGPEHINQQSTAGHVLVINSLSRRAEDGWINSATGRDSVQSMFVKIAATALVAFDREIKRSETPSGQAQFHFSESAGENTIELLSRS